MPAACPPPGWPTAPPLHGSSRMTPQPLLERLITRYPRYCNFMGYFTHKSQPVKSLRTVSPLSRTVSPLSRSVTAVAARPGSINPCASSLSVKRSGLEDRMEAEGLQVAIHSSNSPLALYPGKLSHKGDYATASWEAP